MARTNLPVNSPLAVQAFSAFLASDVPKEGFFGPRLTGEGVDAETPIQLLKELQSSKGEQISYDLSVQLKQQPVEGDDNIVGTEEDLTFYTDSVYINQMRQSVNCGGVMTRKRTMHDLRKVGLKRSKEWWSRLYDEICFIYLSGARGINSGFILPTTFTQFANNSVTAPDAYHQMFAGKKAKNTITTDDKMSLALIDRAVANAGTLGGDTSEIPRIRPIMAEGEKRFVCVMHDWQEYDLRTNASTGQWLDIQKAAAGAVGKDSPIFKGSLGMYNGVVLQKHENVIRFNDYGNQANLPAARALFLGVQAMVVAYGTPGKPLGGDKGPQFSWREDEDNRGNDIIVTSGCIWGAKKVTFNGLDYGVMALDTYAINPNA